MKPVHIVLLLVAGALGGAVVTRVWQAREQMAAHVPHTAPQVARVTPPAASAGFRTASVQPIAAPPAAAPAAAPPAPAVPDHPKTSPIRSTRRAAPPAVRHFVSMAAARPVRHAPPPAHPRPLELGEANPPSPPVPAPEAHPAPAAPPQTVSPPPAPASAAPALAPEPEPSPTVTLNTGTLIPVRLVDSLSSDRNQAGDAFSATLDRELVADGWVIAERGARVEGRVVAADRGTKTGGNASLSVELTAVHTSDGQAVRVQTDRFDRRAPTDRQTDAAKIAGGAVLGAVIGGLAAGGKGAAIGAGAGGAAGTGDVLLTRKPAALASETRLTFRLRAPVTVTEKRD